MCTIEIHLVVLPLANRWGTMLSSGKRIWFCIPKILKARAIKHCGNLVRTHLVTPLTDMFRKNYCNASNWGLVTRLYTYFRSNSAPHMVMTGDYMPQTEWPTCVRASQLWIFIHKFTDGNGNIYFISLDLSICWRWCWFLAIWSFAVSLLRISNLFHFDTSCSHGWPHCMYEPAFMGGALKMVDPQITMVVSTLKWSSVGSFGGNAIFMNCRLCPRRGTAVLAQARAEGAIGRSNGAKEMGGQHGALKTDLVLDRLKWEWRMR